MCATEVGHTRISSAELILNIFTVYNSNIRKEMEKLFKEI